MCDRSHQRREALRIHNGIRAQVRSVKDLRQARGVQLRRADCVRARA